MWMATLFVNLVGKWLKVEKKEKNWIHALNLFVISMELDVSTVNVNLLIIVLVVLVGPGPIVVYVFLYLVAYMGIAKKASNVFVKLDGLELIVIYVS